MNIKNIKRIFLRDLNVNDVFMVPGTGTIYVCEYRRSEGGTTVVGYRVSGGGYSGEFHKPGMSTVDVLL